MSGILYPIQKKIYKGGQINKTMKGETYRGILIVVLVASLALLFLQNANAITGHAVDRSTYSNVSISAYLAIDFSTNLSSGIDFGDVATLPMFNQNATGNYVPTDTSYYVIVSNDSNTVVDVCINASGDMSNGGGDFIGLGNETYSTSSTTDINTPSLASDVALTTAYVEAASDVAIGNNAYFRFWLTVPAGQATGLYNNTVSFKGTPNQGC